MSVLLVDDEADSRSRIRSELQDRGVDVAVSTTVAEANEALALGSFDAVIVEMSLPDGTAMEVLDRLRASGSTSRVIVLGGPTGEGDRVRALERGADDFVVKPCGVGELAACVLAVRRCGDVVADPMLQIGHLRIDRQSREVTSGGEKVALTAKEFDLLAFLAEHPGSVFDREQLLNAVWRSASEWQQAATVTEHIRRLRGKLEIDPAHPTLLTTIRGAGYRLDIPTATPVLRPEAGDVARRPGPGELIHVRCTPDSDATERLLCLVEDFLGDVSDAVIVTDLELHIRSWNAASERLYGWREDEVLGCHVLDVLRWSKDSDQIPEMWELVGQSGRWDGQSSQLGRDGSVVDVLSSTTLVRDQAGDPLGIVSVNRAATAARRVSSLEQDTSTASRLRQGLADDEFDVHYQPVVDLASNRLMTLEALVRWEHPERGTLLPAEFLDTAESSGVIVELGEVVLGKACRQAAEWRRFGADIHLSVNVSARQLADPGIVERFTSIMRDTGFDPGCLWLEVTETALVEEMEKTSVALRRLVDLGVGVSIDDFGTGWASLTYLQNLPVHALKIDRSFVTRAGRRVNDTAIIRSILSLGAELDLFVVAEGIETHAQHVELKKLGCSFGQGYLFGRPVPACDVPIERAARITTTDAPEPSNSPAPAITPQARPSPVTADTWRGVCAYPSDEGRAVHIKDISQDRLQEQFLRSQRMERMGAHASGVAHDLNNILAPLMMATNVLQAEHPGNVSSQMIDTMAACTARAADVLRQILLFARGVECQPVPVAVEGVLGDVEQLCNDTFPEAVVIARTPDDGPLVALGDPAQLHQVLLNLCVNARDAMLDGGTIELSARLVEVALVDVGADDTSPGRYVRIRVQDDGNGMPPEVLDRMFEPFFTTKEHGKGTGLGLATSTGIINAHGGFIRATSTEGIGTTIDVHLPTMIS